MSLLHKTLTDRCLVHQFTGKSLEELCKQVKVVYLGMDATAPSIHVGYLIPMILTRILQKYGVKVIVLLGGATSLIGDPTDKSSARQMLTDEELAKNSAGMMKAIEKFFPGAIVVNNRDWLGELSLIDFITQATRHVSINALVKSELFRKRLENSNPLSLMELLYPVLQAYDFWYLYQNYGCNLQIGGSDQWYNILQGVDLIARKTGQQVFGLTCPLLLTSNGKKMGKSESGAVWLDSELYSTDDFWQYWRNITDEDCVKYMKVLLGVGCESDGIDSDCVKNQKNDAKNINYCKVYLANKLTELVHGTEASVQAEMKARELFGVNDVGRDIDASDAMECTEQVLKRIVAKVFEMSVGDSKRVIEQGGISVDDCVILNADTIVNSGIRLLCKGKKVYRRVRIML